MIPNLYIENGCFTKHPFINGCLGFQAEMMLFVERMAWAMPVLWLKKTLGLWTELFIDLARKRSHTNKGSISTQIWSTLTNVLFWTNSSIKPTSSVTWTLTLTALQDSYGVRQHFTRSTTQEASHIFIACVLGHPSKENNDEKPYETRWTDAIPIADHSKSPTLPDVLVIPAKKSVSHIPVVQPVTWTTKINRTHVETSQNAMEAGTLRCAKVTLVGTETGRLPSCMIVI